MASIFSTQRLTRGTFVKATVAAGGGLILSLSFPRLNAVLAAEFERGLHAERVRAHRARRQGHFHNPASRDGAGYLHRPFHDPCRGA